MDLYKCSIPLTLIMLVYTYTSTVSVKNVPDIRNQQVPFVVCCTRASCGQWASGATLAETVMQILRVHLPIQKECWKEETA